jgi:hypothetical protein
MVQAQRMDSLYRGPLNTGMQDLITGLVSIRVYERVDHFRKRFIDTVEKTSNSTFTFYNISRILSFGLDMLCITAISLITASTIFVYRGRVEPE